MRTASIIFFAAYFAGRVICCDDTTPGVTKSFNVYWSPDGSRGSWVLVTNVVTNSVWVAFPGQQGFFTVTAVGNGDEEPKVN